LRQLDLFNTCEKKLSRQQVTPFAQGGITVRNTDVYSQIQYLKTRLGLRIYRPTTAMFDMDRYAKQDVHNRGLFSS